MAPRQKNTRNPRNPDSSLFKQLTKLLSGPINNRRAQFYRAEKRRNLDKFGSKFISASGKQFKKSSYNPFEYIQSTRLANFNRSERYVEFEQMEYCLSGDTKIAIPNGYITIKELADKCLEKPDHSFIIYAYDHNKQEIVPALGKQARKTRTDEAFKITFENGQELIGTPNHRLMMRDGTYRTIEDLKSGDAMMPFYRKDLINTKKDEGSGYRWIYSMHKREGKRKGWMAEHAMIAEWMAERQLKENEVVHHINFNKNDNRPENLKIMDKTEHSTYHAIHLAEQRKDSEWMKHFSLKHSDFMKGNNPAYRKDIDFSIILSLCEQNGFNQRDLCKKLDTDPETIKKRLRNKGFQNFEIFAKAYNNEWKNSGQNNKGQFNPRFDRDLTYQQICDAYEPSISSNQLAKKLNTTYIKILNRLKSNGFKTFTSWSNTYSNHKIKNIEYFGIIDLYDLTVDGYKNFATDTIISHNTPEIASTLDIYADEMTTWTSLEKMLHIKCPNDEIRGVLENLYENILNIEFNLFGWCRTMCKTGDFFLYLDIDENVGIKNAIGLPPHEVERLEGEDKTNPNYVQFQWNSAGLTFENWQVSHFRVLGNDKYAPYGTSILEPARRIWRQLTLLEDAMMSYRIVRSPERRVFYIDVGNIPPEEVEQFMQKTVTQMKRNQVIDETTGRVDLRYNPMSVEEDYFLPVRGANSQTKIESLPGGTYTGDIDDVKYLRDKLFSALKIPMSYLARGEGSEEDKTTLAQKDIRFARTIQRLQRSIISELEKIGVVHLYLLGYRGDDLISHELSLNNPSKIAELQELEHWKTKFDVAGAATENFFSKSWIAKHIFGLSDEEYLRNERELFHDRRIETMLDQESETLAAEGGGLGGGGLGDLGGGMEGDLGGDLNGETEGEPEETPTAGEQAKESPLLAAPGRREENLTTTPLSNGKMYMPVKHRGGDKRNAGARKRSYLSKAAAEKGSGSKRNVLGSGALELMSLANGIYEVRREETETLNESVDRQMANEKKKIFERNLEIKNLIRDLEKMEDGKKSDKSKTQ